MVTKSIEKSILLLRKEARKLGYSVSFLPTEDGISYVYFDEDDPRIEIYNGSNSEQQLFSLIHEIGHALVKKKKKKYLVKYDKVFEQFSPNSLTYKIKCIEEEYDAWNAGMKLANKLGIKINKRKFEIRRAKDLLTYMKWVAT